MLLVKLQQLIPPQQVHILRRQAIEVLLLDSTQYLQELNHFLLVLLLLLLGIVRKLLVISPLLMVQAVFRLVLNPHQVSVVLSKFPNLMMKMVIQ